MTSNKQILNLQKNGFVLIKRGLTKGFCETLIKRLKKLKPKVFVPNSKTPYGYGNLIEDQQYKKITLNKKLVLFLDQYFKKNTHLIIFCFKIKHHGRDHKLNGIKRYLI